MMRRAPWFSLVLFIAGSALATREARAQGTPAAGTPARACTAAKTALVLSGGGAKGFAHIGVLEIMDSLHLTPDLIVGTSIGSIFGGLYAAGYSGKQIDSITRHLPIEQLIRQYEPKVSSAMGPLRPLAVWEKGQEGFVLQSGAVREAQVNAFLSALMLRANLEARGNFDSLPIPFRAVATDVATRRAVVLTGGDLALAVRASSAIPVVLHPVHIGGKWLVDGGIAENAPVNVARSLGAARTWISLLPFAGPDPRTFDDPLAITAVLLNSLFEQDSITAERRDVIITNPTTTYADLNFSRATTDSLIEIGRVAARAAFAAAPCLKPLSSQPRRVPIPTHITKVALTGATISEGSIVEEQLDLLPGDSLDVPALAAGLNAIGRDERYRSVWLNPRGTGNDVAFDVELEPAPKRSFGGGVAFDQFMSGRLWLGGVDRTLLHGEVEGVGLVRLGSYEQDLDVFARRRALIRGARIPLTAEVEFKHEAVRLFEGGGELPSAETQDLVAFVGLKQDPSVGKWQGEVGVESRVWSEPTVNTRGTVGLHAALFREATEYEMGSIVEVLGYTAFQSARFDASRYWVLGGGFDLAGRVRVGWGNKLPIQETFPLGGDDGFAGFRLGELRGSQELFGSTVIRKKLTSVFRFRLELMTGTVANGYGVLHRQLLTDNGELFGGVRAGLEAATLLGPIRVEEGVANTGQRALLIRVGRWF